MPNWVKNRLYIMGEKADVINLRDFVKCEESPFSFERIIPMPKSLKIVSGSEVDLCIYAWAASLSSNDRDAYIKQYGKVAEDLFDKYKDGDYKLKLDKIKDCSEPHGVIYDSMTVARCAEDRILYGRAYAENILLYGFPTWYDWCCHNWGVKWDACNVSLQSYSDPNGDYHMIVYEFKTAWNSPYDVMITLSKKYPRVFITNEFADEDLGNNCGIFIFRHGEEIAGVIKDYEFAKNLWKE